jgi:hypothetical protein
MSSDLAGNILQIVFACTLAIFGLHFGVLKRELTIYWKGTRWGRRRRYPLTVRGTAATLSGFACVIGGILLLLGTRPEQSGIHELFNAVGCILPISVFGLSFLVQSLINFRARIHENQEN